jgi:hypothetical protein
MAAYAIKNLTKTEIKFDDVLVWVTTHLPTNERSDNIACNVPISAPMTISAEVIHFGHCINHGENENSSCGVSENKEMQVDWTHSYNLQFEISIVALLYNFSEGFER